MSWALNIDLPAQPDVAAIHANMLPTWLMIALGLAIGTNLLAQALLWWDAWRRKAAVKANR